MGYVENYHKRILLQFIQNGWRLCDLEIQSGSPTMIPLCKVSHWYLVPKKITTFSVCRTHLAGINTDLFIDFFYAINFPQTHSDNLNCRSTQPERKESRTRTQWCTQLTTHTRYFQYFYLETHIQPTHTHCFHPHTKPGKRLSFFWVPLYLHDAWLKHTQVLCHHKQDSDRPAPKNLPHCQKTTTPTFSQTMNPVKLWTQSNHEPHQTEPMNPVKTWTGW